MRLHVAGLPHTQLTKAYSSCAFTSLTRQFIDMMVGEGHEVIAYAGSENEHQAHETVEIISKHEQVLFGVEGPSDMDKIPYASAHPLWYLATARLNEEVRKRARPGDVVCLPTGEYGPHLLPMGAPTVEFIAGYQGVSGYNRHVYPSYTWYHAVEAHWNSAYGANPRTDDIVIPHWFDADQLGFNQEAQDYYLYLGRLTDRKGYRIAQEVCEGLDLRLKLAGRLQDDDAFTGYGEYLGEVGVLERRRLLQGAKAVFAPTRYIEPFGLISIEAQASGTPVISSDFGAFVETVENGYSGYRCRTMEDFEYAAVNAPRLNRSAIWAHAHDEWHPRRIATRYTAYFERIVCD